MTNTSEKLPLFFWHIGVYLIPKMQLFKPQSEANETSLLLFGLFWIKIKSLKKSHSSQI